MKSALIFIMICTILCGTSFSAKTSILYNGGVVSLDQPEVKIHKVYGIKLHPVNITVESSDIMIFIPHYVENLSNTSNKIIFSVKNLDKDKGWTAELVRDENGDGKHQNTENKKIGDSPTLSEGSEFYFFLKVKRPENSEPGENGTAIIEISCSIKDGPGYYGYSGLTYGGQDHAESVDRVIVK